MATKRVNISPSINFTETEITYAVQTFGQTALGIVGETLKGRAFDPIKIADYDTYTKVFGGLDPCKFKNSFQPKYETSYIAKSFLSEASDLYVTRLLGLSGYDAGDAWAISFGAAVDPQSVVEIDTSTFTLNIVYINGSINTVTFDNSTLQSLYDGGYIDNGVFGGNGLETGDTITLSNTFITNNCDGTFSGARFNGVLTTIDEPYICITGETITGQNVTTSGVTQTCVVLYSAGTITNDSTFVITVVNPITIINQNNNDLIVVSNGTLQLVGGTIEHLEDGSVVLTDGTIYFPNGDVITGGVYKICDFAGNDALYDCNTVQGSGYTIQTGETTTTLTVYTTGSTIVTTNIPSGIQTFTFSGTVVDLSGSAYTDIDNTLVVLLRSKAQYDADEVLNFDVKGDTLVIESLDGGIIGPYDDFKLAGIKQDGTTFEYVVSLDSRKKNFIGKIFTSFQKCCETDAPLFIEEMYISMFENLVAQNKISCIKPTICFTTTLNNYKTQYRGAVTPWVVSELRGNNVFRLFRLHTFSDGDAANRDIKISIQNIQPDKRLFDLVVRAYDDTDRRPVVLESYTRLSLDKYSNRFIGRAIGTINGEYELRSKYIMLELWADECIPDAFPAGFEGYLMRDYNCAVAPKIQYKTSYGVTDRVRQTYLGLSDTNNGYDQDLFDFKGLPNDPALTEWSGMTKGFHLDSGAASAIIEGVDTNWGFEVGVAEFKNDADLAGTDYEPISARKFSFVPAGGFDGWDIYREQRTNTDDYKANGSSGLLGLASTAFDTYVMDDGTVGITSDYYAYLKGILTFQNPETVRINLFATPGINTFEHSDLIEEAIEMVETDRCDTFYVVTTPDVDADNQKLLAQNIANELDGLYDSSYAATYGYWGQYYDSENNTYLYLPPTGEVMKIFALTDKIAAPWFAGAGINRGITNFEKLRHDPTLAERNTLYDGRINPLAKFIVGNEKQNVVFGNRTLRDDQDSPLKDINIRRLLLYTRRLIADVAIGLLFEPNDQTVRSQFEKLVNPILKNIRDERGIFDFRVKLSSSAEDLASNVLNGTIFIQPTRALEEININFTVTDSSATFDDI